jgi:hypothetical protein
MKPSERLQQITEELLEDVRSRTTAENFEKYSGVYRERAKWRAIAQHLDDEHEQRERDRRAFWAVMAMGMVRANGSVELARKFIERAGLTVFVDKGSCIVDVVSDIESAAREAGLL